MAELAGMTMTDVNNYKLLLVGDANVGKSSLMQRFISKDVKLSDVYAPTIGVDFKVHRMFLKERSINLQLWDSSGQAKFKSIVSSYFKGAAGAILVYDVTDKDSFKNLKLWLKDVETVAKDVTFMVVGNKIDCDASQRKVKKEKARSWALGQGFQYMEVSARSGLNVEEAFVSLVTTLLNRTIEKESKNGGIKEGKVGARKPFSEYTKHSVSAAKSEEAEELIPESQEYRPSTCKSSPWSFWNWFYCRS